MSAIDELAEAILKAYNESPVSTLSIITGGFVGLTLGMLRERGEDPIGDIYIKCDEGRDITIHKEKSCES